jgi:hypothetical protein
MAQTVNVQTSAQVADLAGITYRQLDHWIRSGYLRPAGRALARCDGHDWDTGSIRDAVTLAGLVRLGFTPAAAARLVTPAEDGEERLNRVEATGRA